MRIFVYRWTDLITGKMYIGVHKGELNDGYVCSSKIMLPIYKERPNTFVREILLEGENEASIRAAEIDFLLEVDAARNPLYYNRHNGTNKWYHCGPLSENHKNKISRANKGKIHSPETIEKIRLKKIGWKQSEETKEKRAKKLRGRKNSPETIEKLRISAKNRKRPPLSEIHKKNISAALKGRTDNIEQCRALGYSHKGKTKSPETREKLSLIMKERTMQRSNDGKFLSMTNGR